MSDDYCTTDDFSVDTSNHEEAQSECICSSSYSVNGCDDNGDYNNRDNCCDDDNDRDNCCDDNNSINGVSCHSISDHMIGHDIVASIGEIHHGDRSHPQNLGDVGISDSSDIHVGHNITYKAPVSITQHVYSGRGSSSATAYGKKIADYNSGRSYDSASSTTRDYLSKSEFRFGHCSEKCKVQTSIGAGIVALVIVICIIIVDRLGGLDALAASWWKHDPPTNNEDLVDGLLVARSSWGARAPGRACRALRERPPGLVIVVHTASNWCDSRAQCSASVRNIQQYQMAENDYNDVAYNFMLGGDGLLYEGRGWLVRGAFSGYDYNSKSLGVAFLGNYELDKPTEKQLAAFGAWLELGVARGLLRPDYKLLGHKQISSTDSPGRHLYEAIKKLEHWSPVP